VVTLLIRKLSTLDIMLKLLFVLKRKRRPSGRREGSVPEVRKKNTPHNKLMKDMERPECFYDKSCFYHGWFEKNVIYYRTGMLQYCNGY